ncbi:hypothetical protein [Tunicatimonas pelagia]|uniref:hypothetical protein n=1 Tax=Tunicatimonas pelagia TaxID=931531 RepID=UPI002665ED1A|nr:hypothetical protein [Tunicatimonas pelagia]WKN46466.1 hypothetical protein P0M28_30415 [Tunicatimonas pelagia]
MSLTKGHFAVDPALNVPFSGGSGSQLDRDRLRLLKLELKHNPKARYIKQAVKEFVPGMQKSLERIPTGSTIIVTPSTSGYNTIPADLAKALQKSRADLEFVNLKQDIIETDHDFQSKVKGNYGNLAHDPRQFIFNEAKIKGIAQNKPSAFILDDSVSTGETSFVLQRQLSKRGLYAQGMVAAVSRGQYHTYPSDMLRIYNKLTENYPSDYHPSQIRQDIYTQFAGFPRKKAADFERAITSGNASYRAEAIQYLRNSSEHYRSERLDPQSVLERTPPERTPWVKQPTRSTKDLRNQISINYPNLSDEDADRYSKMMQQQSGKGGSQGKGFGAELE